MKLRSVAFSNLLESPGQIDTVISMNPGEEPDGFWTAVYDEETDLIYQYFVYNSSDHDSTHEDSIREFI